MCPLEVEAKVRPFLKNVRLIVSRQWIPYWPAENCALLELGGVGLEGQVRERVEKTGERSLQNSSVSPLTNDFVKTWKIHLTIEVAGAMCPL